MNAVTDTHALFWYFEDPQKLPTKIIELFDGASVIVIPTIVILELEAILAKKFLQRRFKQLLGELISNKACFIYPLNLEILNGYTGFAESLEMHDRVIVVTAKILNLPLVTKDQEISKIYTKVIW